MELYIVAIVIMGMLIALNLTTLKLSLQTKHPKQHLLNQQLSPPLTIRSIYCFLLQNSTLAETLLTRRAKNKIPILLTISIVSILSYQIQSSYYYWCGIGSILSCMFILLHCYYYSRLNASQKQLTIEPKILVVAYTILISISTISLVALSIMCLYRNYNSKLIQTFLLSLLSNLAIDSLLIQPLFYGLFSCCLGNWDSLHTYIQIESRIIEAQNNINKVMIGNINNLLGVSSPLKRRLSPTKIPKIFMNIQNIAEPRSTDIFEIEPQPIPNKQNTHQPIKHKSKNALPPLQTNLTPTNRKLKHLIEENQQGSIDYINQIDNQFKSITPIAKFVFNSRLNDVESHQEQQPSQNHKNNQVDKINPKCQEIISIPPHHFTLDISQISEKPYESQHQVHNTHPIDEMHSNQQSKHNQPSNIEEIILVSNSANNKNVQSSNNVQSINNNHGQSSINPKNVQSANNNFIIVNKNYEENEENEQNEQQDHEQQNNGENGYIHKSYLRNDPLYFSSEQESQQNCDRHLNIRKKTSIDYQKGNLTIFKNSLLQINEDFKGQIEQLDTNSPQRQRRRPNKLGSQRQQIHYQRRKKMRKYSAAKRRVIKFSSGQPYLEYLPNMLSKQIIENQHKRSQPIVKKKDEIPFDKSKKKSACKFKNTKQPILKTDNIENDCPELYFQDI